MFDGMICKSRIPQKFIKSEGRKNGFWSVEYSSFDDVPGGIILCPESSGTDSETFTKNGARYSDDPFSTWFFPEKICTK